MEEKMNKKKFTLLFLSAMLLTASIVCTQYLAQAMQYDPLLGRYLFKLGDKCIYPPFQCFIWMFKFNKIVRRVFRLGELFKKDFKKFIMKYILKLESFLTVKVQN